MTIALHSGRDRWRERRSSGGSSPSRRLGTTVICTDKTGTLTENSLRLARALPVPGVDERELLAAAVLCSTAEVIAGEDGPRTVGYPVEGALLLAAMEQGLSKADLLAGRRQVLEIPFEPERRRMAVLYEEGDGRRAFVKGAPEVVFELATKAASAELADVARRWAGEGLRVLAVGERRLAEGEEVGDVEAGLDLLGLVALHDPLRAAAPGAIDAARRAGIRICMLTGDHPATARTIGHALGLADDAVYARVTPVEKLRLVEELQAAGEVVAVTGDGINDAPALRRSDVGVAMGRSGTEAAREAAAIVLTDDDFATVVAAVREGRRIADNIRKFVSFCSPPIWVRSLFTLAVLRWPRRSDDRRPGAGDQSCSPTACQRWRWRATRRHRRRCASASAQRAAAAAVRPTLVIAGCSWVCRAHAFLAGRAFGGGVAQTMAFATIGWPSWPSSSPAARCGSRPGAFP
jgi:Ca2+-transporting ATPase